MSLLWIVLLLVAAQRLAEAQRDEAFLRHAVEELDALDPRPGEEAELGEKRNRLMHREKLVEGLNAAAGSGGVCLGVLDDGLEPSTEGSSLGVVRHGDRTGQRTGGG